MCFHSPELVYLCFGLGRRWQERLPLPQGQPAGKNSAVSHWSLFTVYINYFFGVTRMSTIGFAPLCLTSLAERILELGDTWDRSDRGESRPFDNQLFSCQRIIKWVQGITCIWSKNISQVALFATASFYSTFMQVILFSFFSKCSLNRLFSFLFTGFSFYFSWVFFLQGDTVTLI